MKHRHRPVTISGGVVKIPLGPEGTHVTEFAEMDVESFQKLQSLGFTGNFNKAGRCVVAAAPVKLYGKSNNLDVTRIVTGAKEGEYVRHLDGNPLNLRKNNLHVIKASRPGKYRNYGLPYLVVND